MILSDPWLAGLKDEHEVVQKQRKDSLEKILQGRAHLKSTLSMKPNSQRNQGVFSDTEEHSSEFDKSFKLEDKDLEGIYDVKLQKPRAISLGAFKSSSEMESPLGGCPTEIPERSEGSK